MTDGTVFGSIRGVRVTGTATAFPRDVDELAVEVDNEGVFRALLGEGWVEILASRGEDLGTAERRYGVRRRQWVALPGHAPRIGVTELAIEAARRALVAAGRSPSDVDLVVVATSTPDRVTSSVSARVAKGLGVPCASFDVRAGGACGLHAWLLAASLLQHGPRTALVVTSEVGTPLLDPEDLAAWLVYADGAAAFVLERDGGDSGLLGAVLGTEAAPGRPFTVPGALPPTVEAVREGRFRWQKPDRAYLDALERRWSSTCSRLRTEFPEVAIDAFAPYRATRRQVEAAAAAVGVPLEQTAADVGEHGCVGSAGPLVGVHELATSGRLARGQVVASAAVAGGVVWHAMLWRW